MKLNNQIGDWVWLVNDYLILGPRKEWVRNAIMFLIIKSLKLTLERLRTATFKAQLKAYLTIISPSFLNKKNPLKNFKNRKFVSSKKIVEISIFCVIYTSSIEFVLWLLKFFSVRCVLYLYYVLPSIIGCDKRHT